MNLPRAVLALVCLLVPAHLASAQSIFESAGERALGMGGAFVAVADDATATYWNPSGLVAGSPGGATVGWYRFQAGNPTSNPVAGAIRQTGTLTSLGTWPLGVSYGHFERTALDTGASGAFDVTTLHTSFAGVTVLQTLAEGLVGGVTMKYVRGDVVRTSSTDATLDEAFQRTKDLQGGRSGALDFDIGLMADMQQVRVGFTCRNLRSPEFGTAGQAQESLLRETRLGVAVLPTHGLTLAMDLDLNTVDLRGDLRRVIAMGGEGRMGRHFAVRTGVRWDLEGDRRLIGSVGLSIGIRRGLWLDGHYAHGRRDEDREFGAALRAGL